MPKALVKISYTQYIDANVTTDFEKRILSYSFEEYKMKQQAYNPDGTITRFTVLKAKDGRANSLHYKTGFSIGGIINTLKNKINVVQDNTPMDFKFAIYRLEVIESDINDIQLHKIAVHYISDTLTLFEVIGNYMIVAYGDYSDLTQQNAAETFLIKVQPNMNVISYTELPK